MVDLIRNHVSSSQLGRPRRVIENGRVYWVAPITSIVPGVLPGSKGPLYYPPEECARNAEEWDGYPITLGHPTIAGRPTSASHPAVENLIIGHLRNSTFNRKLKHEGWFDEERVRNADRELPDHLKVLPKLMNGQPIEESTGVYTDNYKAPPNANHNGRPYIATARNYKPDHIAVLVHDRGACSLEDGCGVMINRRVPVFNMGCTVRRQPMPTRNKEEEECPECGAEMEENDDGKMECERCGYVENALASIGKQLCNIAHQLKDAAKVSPDEAEEGGKSNTGGSKKVGGSGTRDRGGEPHSKVSRQATIDIDNDGDEDRTRAAGDDHDPEETDEDIDQTKNSNPEGINQYSKGGRAAAEKAKNASSRAVSFSSLAGSIKDQLNGARDEARSHASSALKAAGQGNHSAAAGFHMKASERHYALATHPEHAGTAFEHQHMAASHEHDEAAKAHMAAQKLVRNVSTLTLAEHIGFAALSEKLQGKGHDKESADAIAATVGRKKYGAAGMARKSAKGKKAAETENGHECTNCPMTGNCKLEPNLNREGQMDETYFDDLIDGSDIIGNDARGATAMKGALKAGYSMGQAQAMAGKLEGSYEEATSESGEKERESDEFKHSKGAAKAKVASREASAATKHAESTKSKGAHRKAATAHRAAAKEHRSEGNKKVAAEHSAQALRHDRKARGATRNQLTEELVGNTQCPALEGVLNQLSERDFYILQANIIENARKESSGSHEEIGQGKGKDVQAGGADDDEDNDDEFEDDVDVDEGKTKLAENRLLAQSPRLREIVKNYNRQQARAKLNLARQLVSNIADKALRINMGNRLMKKSVEELQEMMLIRNSVAPSTSSAGVRDPIFLGATGADFGRVDNSSVDGVEEGAFEVPTLNWDEVIKYQRDQGVRK